MSATDLSPFSTGAAGRRPPAALTIGNFDGVHKGHQQLIGKAVRAAKRHGLKSAVFTFSNHPKAMLGDGREVKNIIYQEEKTALIEKLGLRK